MRIVMVSQQVPHYTGGRYYAYQVACNLSLLGHEVTLLVDRELDHIVRDYAWVSPTPTVVKGNLMSGVGRLRGRVGRADLVIGVPIQGVHVAAGLARLNKCPMWVFIYDPPPLLARYRGDEGVREVKLGFWNELKRVINASAGSTVVTLAQHNVNPTKAWLQRTSGVSWLHPAVNDPLVVFQSKRELWATWISRIVPHKKFPHALDAVKPFNLHMNVICSRAHKKIVAQRKMVDRVTWLVNQPDEVKFKTLSRSMLLVHTATYEGFGMPLIEAMYCGVPVVCYDLPIYREIFKNTNAKVFIAPDRAALPGAVAKAFMLSLQGGLSWERDTRFDMLKQRKRLKRLLKDWL